MKIKPMESAWPVANATFMDVEIAGNDFFVGFKFPDGRIIHAETPEHVQALLKEAGLIVTFNGIGYDTHMVGYFLAGATHAQLLNYSDELIDHKVWEAAPLPDCDHIDIMGVTGVRASLKALGTRLGYSHLDELPFEPGAMLRDEQKKRARAYNIHDLNITALLYQALSEPLALRQKLSTTYNLDLRSLSDSQIAERVMGIEYQRKTGVDVRQLRQMAGAHFNESIQVRPPSWWDKVQDATLREHGQSIFERTYPLTDGKLAVKDDRHLILGARSYKAGFGGIHSVDMAGTWSDCELVDADVTSYYPSIMLNERLIPSHMNESFIETLRELTERRVAAKAAGDMTTANGLKITINSIFGKTNYEHSILFDPQMMAQVTITGQLALLWLISRVEATNSAVCVSANTDGATFKVSNIPAFRQACAEWEADTAFNLEETRYKKLVQRDINNYLAIKTDGTIKAKGVFNTDYNLSQTLKGAVIAEAVVRNLSDKTHISKTVRNTSELSKFIFTATSTSGFTYNGQPVGKQVRYYHATDGQQLYSGERKAPNAESVVILPVLPHTLPDNINYKWYIDKAKDLLQGVTIQKDQARNLRAYQLKDLGLHPAPLWGGKFTPKGHGRTAKPVEQMDFTPYPNFGTGTGADAGLVVLDIDKVDLLPDSIKSKLTPTMAVQAGGEYDFEGVRAGTVRGKLIYSFTGNLPKKSTANALKKHGVEVFYGEVVAIEGPRNQDNKVYRLDGQIEPLPEDLYNELRALCYTKAQLSSKSAQVEFKTDLSVLEQVYATYPELSTLHYKPHDQRAALVSHCPANHAKPGDRDLMLSVGANNRLYAYCLHGSCSFMDEHKASLQAHHRQLVNKATATAARAHVKKVPFKRPPGSCGNIVDALSQEDDQLLVLAPTGAGKSYGSALYTLKQIKAGNLVIYISANKTDAEQWEDTLVKLSGLDSLADLGGLKIYRSDWGDSDSSTSSKWPNNIDDFTVIITHHTYLQRKGDSTFFYPIWRKIKDSTVPVVILVDEVDALIESSVRTLTLDTTQLTQKNKGDVATVDVVVNRCPAYVRKAGTAPANNCASCTYTPDTLHWQVNGSQLFEYTRPPRLLKDDPRKVDPAILPPVSGTCAWKTFEFSDLTTHENYAASLNLTRIEPGDDFVHDANAYLNSLVQSAWRPRMVVRRPHQVSEDWYAYPGSPCQERTLILADKAPFIGLHRYPAKVRLMTATLSEAQSALLDEVMPALQTVHVDVAHNKISESAVILLNYRSSASKVIEYASAQRTFINTAYRRELRRYKKRLPDKTITLYDSGHYNPVEMSRIDNGVETDILVTYSGSSLSRGINLPKYKTCIIVGQPFKPTTATLARDLESIQQAAIGEVTSMALQGMGRILRTEEGESPSRRLFIITEPMTDEEGRILRPTRIIDSIQRRTESTVQVITTANHEQTIRAVKAWSKGGQLPQSEGVKTSSLSKSARKKVKRGDRLQARREEIVERLKTETFESWREASRVLHLSRYFSEEERNELKTLFEH